jgi:phosphatidylserine/phosphatidylglycerophosphate/cardiolipin synthase-like enzyme
MKRISITEYERFILVYAMTKRNTLEYAERKDRGMYTRSLVLVIFLVLSLLTWRITVERRADPEVFMTNKNDEIIANQVWIHKPLQQLRTWERYGPERLGSLEDIQGTLLISPWWVYDEIMQRLEKTRYTLDLWFYRIAESSIQKTLCRMIEKWVRVRLVHESMPYESLYWTKSEKTFSKISRYLEGCKRNTVRSDEWIGVVFSHQKIAVRDQSEYLLASANFTYPSFFSHRDHWVLGNDPRIAQSLSIIIDADWNKKPIDTSLIHQNILVCPLACKEQLLTFLASAKHTIRIQTQYIQDTEVIETLMRAKDSLGTGGVSIIVSANQAPWRLDSIYDGVRIQEYPYVHTKTVLIDDRWLLIGSMNFSTNALENNRELSMIFTDARARSRYTTQFLKDRESATPYKQFKR